MEKNDFGGVLCFNKPAGCTSHDIVYRVRKLYGTKQVGHTGTLDPLATGVLVVMVGRAVKASEFLTADEKEYVATLKLGLTTDTEDITGEVLSEYKGEMPDFETVKSAVFSFTGEIEQVPPMYSALKKDGKKLIDLARQGITVEREARKVRVDKIDVFETEKPDEFLLNVRVSKGTYIRTLCADIGKKLGCGGTMKTLMRLEASGFTLEDAVTLEQLEAMSESDREKRLLPTEVVFRSKRSCTLSSFFGKLGRAGAEIYLRKIGFSAEVGERVALFDDRGFFALGEVKEYPDGFAIKPIKQFDTPVE